MSKARYVCACMCVYVCLYVYVSVYVYVFVFTYVCVCMCHGLVCYSESTHVLYYNCARGGWGWEDRKVASDHRCIGHVKRVTRT